MLLTASEGDMLNKYQFGSRKQLEEGHKANEMITLYYAGPNAEYLIGEERNIKELTPLKAVQALIEGPRKKDLTRVLPIELEVIDVSIEDGVAHVYIHESVPLDRHGNFGSSTSTTFIMNSISATL
jgi:spore germination protein GerM